MAMRIDNIRYPNDLHGLLGAPDLSDVFEHYVEKRPDQAANMLTFLAKEPRPEKVYEKYLKKNAPYPVMKFVDSNTRKIALKLELEGNLAKLRAEGDVPPARKPSGATWQQVREMMKAQFIKEFDGKIIPDFFKSTEFKKYHEDLCTEQAKEAMGSAEQVAKTLAIKDVNQLKKVMQALADREKPKAKTLAKELIESEKLEFKVDDFLKKLKAGNLPRAKKAAKKKLNVSEETMTKCGFVDTDNKVIHKWLATLVDAINDNDRILLQSASSKIVSEARKDAKKKNGAKIAKVNAGGLLDLLYKSKVIV